MHLNAPDELLKQVRERPALFIGGADQRGLQLLARMAIGPAVTRVVAYGSGTVTVTRHRDDSIEVMDDGGGAPTGICPKTGIPEMALSLCLDHNDLPEKCHYGRPFCYPIGSPDWPLRTSSLAPLNALSSWLELASSDGSRELQMGFENGTAVGCDERSVSSPNCGLRLRFLPDWSRFSATEWDWEALTDELRTLAYTVPEVTLVTTDEATGIRQVFHETDGALAFLRSISFCTDAPPPVRFTSRVEQGEVDLAVHFQYLRPTRIVGFANGVSTAPGGADHRGLQERMVSLIYRTAATLPPFADRTLPDFARLSGLIAAVSIRLPDACWEGAARTRVGNVKVHGLVGDALEACWLKWERDQPEAAARMAHAARELAWWAELYRD